MNGAPQQPPLLRTVADKIQFKLVGAWRARPGGFGGIGLSSAASEYAGWRGGGGGGGGGSAEREAGCCLGEVPRA